MAATHARGLLPQAGVAQDRQTLILGGHGLGWRAFQQR